MKNNKILITGTSGFIGTNIVEYFLKRNYDILAIDINTPKIETHQKVWKNIDIRNFSNLKDEITSFSPGYIIHLAARTDLNGKTLDDYSSNIKGVENLMRVITLLPDLKKIIITSSMLVCHTGYYPKNQFDYSPTTIYGKSKVETERIVWANKPHCDWAIIRPTSIWGPWFGEPYRNFFDMVISHKYFHIGNRGCTKTYGYVGNAIYQIERILFSETKNENNKVFYIGDEPATNIEEWGNEIANELGYKIIKMPFFMIKCAALCGDILKKIGVSFPMTTFRLNNMTTNNIIDLSATTKIAPNPPFSRKEGIVNTLTWLKNN